MPIIKTIKDNNSAKIINPIVVGNFNNRRFINEKIDAKHNKIVDNSRTPIFFIFIKYSF